MKITGRKIVAVRPASSFATAANDTRAPGTFVLELDDGRRLYATAFDDKLHEGASAQGRLFG
jgi:hypothetical protein